MGRLYLILSLALVLLSACKGPAPKDRELFVSLPEAVPDTYFKFPVE